MSSYCDSDSSEWEEVQNYGLESHSKNEEQVIEQKVRGANVENAVYCLEHPDKMPELVCIHTGCSHHIICSSCDSYGGSKEEGIFKNENHKFVPIFDYIEFKQLELKTYLESIEEQKMKPIFEKMESYAKIGKEWEVEERHLLSVDYAKLLKIKHLIQELSSTENTSECLEKFEELRKLRIEEKRIEIPRPFRDWEKEIEADCEHVIFCGMSSILAFFPFAFILLLFGGEAMEYQKGISILYKGQYSRYRQKRLSFRRFEDLNKTPAKELKKCKVYFFLRSKEICEFMEGIGKCMNLAESEVSVISLSSISSDDMKKVHAKYTVGDACARKLRKFIFDDVTFFVLLYLIFCLTEHFCYPIKPSHFLMLCLSLLLQYISRVNIFDNEKENKADKFASWYSIFFTFSFQVSQKLPIVGIPMSFVVFTLGAILTFVIRGI